MMGPRHQRVIVAVGEYAGCVGILCRWGYKNNYKVGKRDFWWVWVQAAAGEIDLEDWQVCADEEEYAARMLAR